MHPTASRFAKRAKEEFGFEVEIKEFSEGTKTAEDAAQAIGCNIAQIAKSIAMKVDDDLVVVITRGIKEIF